jgi:hypothetical protein
MSSTRRDNSDLSMSFIVTYLTVRELGDTVDVQVVLLGVPGPVPRA